jgi:DNA-directed RNA polymerase specialized sigma24 family protein
MDNDSRLDVARCEDLAALATGGDANAWQHLMTQVWPALLRVIASNASMRRSRASDDDVREVATSVVEKLGRNDLYGLRQYGGWRAQHPEKTFKDWLFIVAANAVRDHVRAARGEAPPGGGGDLPSVKRLLNEFLTSPTIDRIGARPPMTAAQTARELLEFASARLRAEQLGALTRWMDGAEPEEIATDLGLARPDDARKLVRSAVAILRREFAGGEKNDPGA